MSGGATQLLRGLARDRSGRRRARSGRPLFSGALVLVVLSGSVAARSDEDAPIRSPPQNPIPALAAPTAPGRTGPRIMSRTAFDAGDLAWVTFAAIGASLMIPGWVLFYRARMGRPDLSRVAGQVFLLTCLVSLCWAFVTYSLAFGVNWGGESAPEADLVGPDGQFTGLPVIGGAGNLALRGLEPSAAADDREYPLRRRRDAVPHMLFMGFQMFVAMMGPVPLVVVLSDRVKTAPLIAAALGWSIVVYAPLAHWIWGFGWLRQLGAQDFAGGAVLQMAAGFSALTLLALLPRRASVWAEETSACSGMACLGGTLLWAGALFLSGGSALSAGPSAVAAVLCTHLAVCAGALAWAGAGWLRDGRATFGDLAAGAASGSAAIASCSGLVALQSALVIGLVSGIVCRAACTALATGRERGLMTVFAIQGAGGCLGLVLTGVFASSNFAGADHSGRPIEGLLSGNPAQLRLQALAALSAAALAVAGSALVFGTVRVLARGNWLTAEIQESASDSASA